MLRTGLICFGLPLQRVRTLIMRVWSPLRMGVAVRLAEEQKISECRRGEWALGRGERREAPARD